MIFGIFFPFWVFLALNFMMDDYFERVEFRFSRGHREGPFTNYRKAEHNQRWEFGYSIFRYCSNVSSVLMNFLFLFEPTYTLSWTRTHLLIWWPAIRWVLMTKRSGRLFILFVYVHVPISRVYNFAIGGGDTTAEAKEETLN